MSLFVCTAVQKFLLDERFIGRSIDSVRKEVVRLATVGCWLYLVLITFILLPEMIWLALHFKCVKNCIHSLIAANGSF